MIDTSQFENKKAAYYTLGCKLNFAETSTLGRLLSERGFRKAGQGEVADLCVINTCSVTELADKKCRQTIRRITKQHPGARVVVTGCYAQLKPEEVAHIEGVDLVLGAEQKMDILKYLEALDNGQWEKNGQTGTPTPGDAPSPIARSGLKIISSPVKDIRTFSPSCSADDRTRHFLKVQDGCDYFCSYCTIPFARGRSRNGSIESLVAQARQVAREGGKEIVLTGVNIGDFGKSTGETFISLLRALDEVEGILRYRISSIEPNLITDEAIDFVAHSRRFAPHFHIPLQSGSDTVLKLMRRRYDTALFRHKIEKIKQMMPHAFIGVDVIVGTRGETEACFEEAYRFIENLDISRLHVFSYSERPGTQALKIDHVVEPRVKHVRSRELIELSERKLRAFCEAHIGHRAEVLFEHTRKGGMMHGFTGNYIRVERPYDASLANTLCLVELGGWNADKSALTIKHEE